MSGGLNGTQWSEKLRLDIPALLHIYIRKRKSSNETPTYQETKASSFSHQLHPVPEKQADAGLRLWENLFLKSKGFHRWTVLQENAQVTRSRGLVSLPMRGDGDHHSWRYMQTSQGQHGLWNTSQEVMDLKVTHVERYQRSVK